MTVTTETSRRSDEAGLTLVELLVVLLIIALIAGFAVPRVVNYLSGARSDAAEIQIKRLGGVLELYRLDTGRYPTTGEGLAALMQPPADGGRWNGPYLESGDALTDPWGRPYRYAAPGRSGDYDLYSLGADGQEGGEGEDADIYKDNAG